MGMSRSENVDNRKFGPATTKADASQPVQWRQAIGEWDAPGQQMVTDSDMDSGIDDAAERNATRTGPQSDSPVTP